MAGRGRDKKSRNRSEEQEAGDAANGGTGSNTGSDTTKDAEEDLKDAQPGRRVPGINGYDPTQWPDAGR